MGKVLSSCAVAFALVLALPEGVIAAPVPVTIHGVFTSETPLGGAPQPMAIPVEYSRTFDFDVNSYSVTGWTNVIGFNSYQDVTRLTYEIPYIDVPDQSSRSSYTYNSDILWAPNSTITFDTISNRINGAPAQFVQAVFTLRSSFYGARFGLQDYMSDFEFKLVNSSPSPNDGNPLNFLFEASQSPALVVGSMTDAVNIISGMNTGYTVYTGSGDVILATEVPEPASMAILLTGLVGLGAMRRRKARPDSASYAIA